MVSVIHEGLGVSLRAKCVKYIYDCVRRKYNRIELGQPRPDFGGVITDRAVGAAAVTDTALTAHLGDMNAHFPPEEGMDTEADGAVHLSGWRYFWLCVFCFKIG